MNNNMSKLDVKALGKALLLTGSVLLGSLMGLLLVKYANPIVTTMFLIGLMVGFFYFIFKD